MKVINENFSLITDYKPWGGAKAVVGRMSTSELILIENFFDEFSNECDETLNETQINDFFWFDDEQWLQIIDCTEEEFYKRPIVKQF